jgi:hypothetical protein
MADTKISALTASTTPLAGTEVLPIVQSGVTKQVSVANLTAGRAISATELTLSTGNLIIGTSGKGIDFSATPGTGTSELLADYEEGTWTAELTTSGTGPTTPVFVTGYYTKVGRQVTASCAFEGVNTTGASGNLRVAGLPFAANASTPTISALISMAGFGAAVASSYLLGGNTYFQLVNVLTDDYIAIVAGTGKTLRVTITYFV